MVGASADMMVTPVGAIIAGSLGGIITTCGFKWVQVSSYSFHSHCTFCLFILSQFILQPFLGDKLKIHDTAGVNNLHGMPGLSLIHI